MFPFVSHVSSSNSLPKLAFSQKWVRACQRRKDLPKSGRSAVEPPGTSLQVLAQPRPQSVLVHHWSTGLQRVHSAGTKFFHPIRGWECDSHTTHDFWSCSNDPWKNGSIPPEPQSHGIFTTWQVKSWGCCNDSKKDPEHANDDEKGQKLDTFVMQPTCSQETNCKGIPRLRIWEQPPSHRWSNSYPNGWLVKAAQIANCNASSCLDFARSIGTDTFLDPKMLDESVESGPGGNARWDTEISFSAISTSSIKLHEALFPSHCNSNQTSKSLSHRVGPGTGLCARIKEKAPWHPQALMPRRVCILISTNCRPNHLGSSVRSIRATFASHSFCQETVPAPINRTAAASEKAEI